MTDAKPWYKSATLWINAASLALVVLSGALDMAGVLQLTAQEIVWFTIAVAVLNALQRILNTNKPIAGTPAADALKRERTVERRIQERLHG